MTASCFSTPLPAHRLQRRLPRRREPGATRAVLLAAMRLRVERLTPCLRGLVVVGVLLIAAVVLAPEQPLAQADICERHNGAAACRVW